ncbi:MAG: discoidin domain-containing protein [Acidimicrobiia bacterium]
MSRRTALLAVATALVVAACGSSADTEVLPFSEIAVADPQIVFDPSGTVATLNVTTNLDAVCAVAYGIDGPSGSIATDQDMGVGGHSDHAAVMTGLQPETTYQYRLQGVAADGNLYRSEVLTFTTPAADETLTRFGENVAIDAAVVEVSSEFSDDFTAANAVDGDLGTEWSSQGDGDDAFLTVDLGRIVDATAVLFRTRSMGDGSSITETFNVVVDGTTFGPFPAGADPVEVSFTGQIVTFEVASSTGGNTGAVEVEIFEG